MLKKITLYIILPIFALIAIGIFMQYQSDIPVATLKARYADASSQFINLNGLEVHYKDEGNGFPLLLLHGTGASLHTWDGWVESLSDTIRCIRLDLPAFGITGPNATHDYSMAAYTDFVAIFLKAMSIDSCDIAGNSLGGQIAWEFAVRNSAKIRKMILVDAAGFPNDSDPLVFQLARNPVTKLLLRNIGSRALIEKSLLDVYVNDDLVTESLVDRYYEFSLREGNRDAFIARANTKFADNTDKLTDLKTPTLIIWGALDTWTPLSGAEQFHQRLPNSELMIFEDTGHVPMEEIPQKTARAARAFLLQ